MENILFYSARAVFGLSILLFTISYFINKLFDNANPDDLLAPLAQSFANLVSNGFYYIAVGFLILAIFKFIYEWIIDNS